MTSFSRGHMMLYKLFTSSSSSSRICSQCLGRIQRAQSSSPSQSARQLRRQLSTSRILSQIHKLRASKPLRPSSRTQASRTSDGVTEYASRLNQTLTTPTIIYQSPPQRALIAASLGLSTFFIGYGIFNAWSPGFSFLLGTPTQDPGGKISWIIPPILVFAGGVLIAVGVWSYGACRGLVKKITIVPGQEMMATVRVSRWVPWRIHEIKVPLRELALGRRMQDTAPLSNDLASRYQNIKDANIFLRPFLSGGSMVRSFFDETKNVFWRGAFVTLDLAKEGKFTLDARGSAYQGAEGLDRIIPVGYGKGRFWEGLS